LLDVTVVVEPLPTVVAVPEHVTPLTVQFSVVVEQLPPVPVVQVALLGVELNVLPLLGQL
jgi:hypothetical protein